MDFDQVASLLEPEKLPFHNGVERVTDGVLHVAVRTAMPRVEPRMIAWWFGEYMQTTEHYVRWHPRDHVWMDWENKQAGTHVGASHLVHEYIGGRLNRLRITFVDPAAYFGEAWSDVTNDVVAICARPGLLDRPIDIGHMVHLAVPTPWGCELHSRFWLGHIESRSGTRWIESLGNRRSMRRMMATKTRGRALALHCHQEMTTLAEFLPDLFAAEAR